MDGMDQEEEDEEEPFNMRVIIEEELADAGMEQEEDLDQNFIE